MTYLGLWMGSLRSSYVDRGELLLDLLSTGGGSSRGESLGTSLDSTLGGALLEMVGAID